MPEPKAPFHATETLSGLKPRTTASGHAKIRNWNEEIKRASLFSARTTHKAYLDGLQETLQDIADRKTTPELAAYKLKARLGELGYRPETGFKGDAARWHGVVIPPATPGSITDLSSSRRINLVIDTNVKQAISMGQLSTSDNPVFLMANPAWELTRVGARKKPRKDWRDRWRKAGEKVGWKGALKRELIALKDSPIWGALGDGTGGYGDVLGTDYPPYAFGSGMGWVNCGRKRWKDLCKAEGVPDQLESIIEKARALKRAQEAAGGEGAYGAGAVAPTVSELAKGGFDGRVDSAMDITYETPAVEVFKADESFRKRISEAVADARKSASDKAWEADEAAAKMDGYRRSVEDVAKEWPEFDAVVAPYLAEVESVGKLLAGISADAKRAEGDMVRKQADGWQIATPVDAESQDDADGRADSLVAEVRALEDAVKVLSVADAVRRAENAVQDARKSMDDRLKAECDALVDEAQKAVDALADDEFEKIKDEFKAARKGAGKAKA